MTKPQLWYYSIPPTEEDRFSGWGMFVLGSNGFFAAVTDYGNYAYKWTNFEPKEDFRKFFIECNWDYIRHKIHPAEEYDGDKTLVEVKKEIIYGRRHENMPKAIARQEWERLEYYNDLQDKEDFEGWASNTHLGTAEVYELVRTSPPADIRMFGERLLPRLKQAILDSKTGL